jgi:site-specific DNA-methyltransferase (adenine-specific)
MIDRPYVALDSPRIELYLMDCVAGLAQLEEGSVSVAVTSPPYNIGVNYRSYDDTKPREEYFAWIREVASAVHRVMEPEGSFFMNVGGRPTDPWLAWDVASQLRGTFVLQNAIHWIKSIAIDKRGQAQEVDVDSVGHYKPITSPRFLHDCQEYIFHFTKTGAVSLDRLAIGVPYSDKGNIGRWKVAQQDLRCRGNTWFIPYRTIRDRTSQRPHPSTFPVQLPEMCIKLHGADRVRRVLDPFVGLGSTAIAAQRLGLPCVGFDLDQYYLDIARRQLTAWVDEDLDAAQLPLGVAEDTCN